MFETPRFDQNDTVYFWDGSHVREGSIIGLYWWRDGPQHIVESEAQQFLAYREGLHSTPEEVET